LGEKRKSQPEGFVISSAALDPSVQQYFDCGRQRCSEKRRLVSRIESVAKSLNLPIVVSDDFARDYGEPLRPLGRHGLRGLAIPHDLFSVHRQNSATARLIGGQRLGQIMSMNSTVSFCRRRPVGVVRQGGRWPAATKSGLIAK
jgi:hypothetical protein